MTELISPLQLSLQQKMFEEGERMQARYRKHIRSLGNWDRPAFDDYAPLHTPSVSRVPLYQRPTETVVVKSHTREEAQKTFKETTTGVSVRGFFKNMSRSRLYMREQYSYEITSIAPSLDYWNFQAKPQLIYQTVVESRDLLDTNQNDVKYRSVTIDLSTLGLNEVRYIHEFDVFISYDYNALQNTPIPEVTVEEVKKIKKIEDVIKSDISTSPIQIFITYPANSTYRWDIFVVSGEEVSSVRAIKTNDYGDTCFVRWKQEGKEDDIVYFSSTELDKALSTGKGYAVEGMHHKLHLFEEIGEANEYIWSVQKQKKEEIAREQNRIQEIELQEVKNKEVALVHDSQQRELEATNASRKMEHEAVMAILQQQHIERINSLKEHQEENKVVKASYDAASAQTKTAAVLIPLAVGIFGAAFVKLGAAGLFASQSASIVNSITAGMMSHISAAGEFISGCASTCWNGIKEVASTVWNGVKSVGNAIWNGIKSVGGWIASWF